MEIPKSKSQIPNKLQIPSPKFQMDALLVEAGLGWNLRPWNLFGIWDLDFGICPP